MSSTVCRRRLWKTLCVVGRAELQPRLASVLATISGKLLELSCGLLRLSVGDAWREVCAQGLLTVQVQQWVAGIHQASGGTARIWRNKGWQLGSVFTSSASTIFISPRLNLMSVGAVENRHCDTSPWSTAPMLTTVEVLLYTKRQVVKMSQWHLIFAC